MGYEERECDRLDGMSITLNATEARSGGCIIKHIRMLCHSGVWLVALLIKLKSRTPLSANNRPLHDGAVGIRRILESIVPNSRPPLPPSRKVSLGACSSYQLVRDVDMQNFKMLRDRAGNPRYSFHFCILTLASRTQNHQCLGD